MKYSFENIERNKVSPSASKAKSITDLVQADNLDRVDYYPPFVWHKDQIEHPHYTKWRVAERYGLSSPEDLKEEKVSGVGTRFWLPQRSEYTVYVNRDNGLENHNGIYGFARYYFSHNESPADKDKMDYNLAFSKMTTLDGRAVSDETKKIKIKRENLSIPSGVKKSEAYLKDERIKELEDKNMANEEIIRKQQDYIKTDKDLDNLKIILDKNIYSLLVESAKSYALLMDFELLNAEIYEEITKLPVPNSSWMTEIDKFISQIVKTIIGDTNLYKKIKDIGSNKLIYSVLHRSALSRVLAFLVDGYIFNLSGDKETVTFNIRINYLNEIFAERDYSQFETKLNSKSENISDAVDAACSGSQAEQTKFIMQLNEAYAFEISVLKKFNETLKSKIKNRELTIAAGPLELWMMENASFGGNTASHDKEGKRQSISTAKWREALAIVKQQKKDYSSHKDRLTRSQSLPYWQVKRQCEMFGLKLPGDVRPNFSTQAIKDKDKLPQIRSYYEKDGHYFYLFKKGDLIPGKADQFIEMVMDSVAKLSYGYKSIGKDQLSKQLEKLKNGDSLIMLSGSLLSDMNRNEDYIPEYQQYFYYFDYYINMSETSGQEDWWKIGFQYTY